MTLKEAIYQAALAQMEKEQQGEVFVRDMRSGDICYADGTRGRFLLTSKVEAAMRLRQQR